MPEATLHDGVPVTAGWFIVNARDTPWTHSDLRSYARFGGQGDAHFDHLGIGLYWLEAGQAMSMYHHEAGQEDFLVLRGRGVAIVEETSRPIGPWDLLHCPPGVAHTIANDGDGPLLIFAVGARVQKGSAVYPTSSVALAHDAGVRPGESPDAAYARFGPSAIGGAPPGF